MLPPVHRGYKGKGRYKPKRPGTSDSGQGLLADEPAEAEEGISQVYMYYRHSMISLTDIIDTVRAPSPPRPR